MSFWSFQNKTDTEAELRIEGEIVSSDDAWLYEWFEIQHATPNAFRTELANHKGKNITVWVDSWGGDTTAAAGIYNALKEHKGKVTVKIDGKAVSAASVIAMAGDEVQMSPLGLLMVHNPWAGVTGDANEMRHMADVLDTVKETIINAYEGKTKKDRKALAKMMDNETWMSPKTALEEGFIDAIMYTTPETKNAFTIDRVAIQNSACESVRKFIDQYKSMNPVEPPPKASQGNTLDIYYAQVQINQNEGE